VLILKTHVFPDMLKNYINHEWICERAIFAPTNNKVDDIPMEFLNSLTIPGLHILTLKIVTPIMILRNINPPKLFNGTR